MISADNHLHTIFSIDSDEPMENQVKRGIELGLGSICFTDHMDYNYPHTGDFCDVPEDEYLFEFDVKAYMSEIERLKSIYAESINLRTGIELGIKEDMLEKGKKLLSCHKFDFVIASTHLVDNKDPYYIEYWEGKSVKDQLKHYYETILNNVKIWKDYDVVGHIDYMVRYVPALREGDKNLTSFISKASKEELINSYIDDNIDIIEAILSMVIEDGKGIELNTAGFKAGLNHPNPHERILKLYKEKGGEVITIGSDAHSTEYLGHCFDKAEDILKSIGFRYTAVYEGRKPKFMKL